MERLSIPGDVCTREAAHAKDSKQSTSLICRRKKDGVEGSNFCGLVERKPFKKLKE